MSDFIQNFHFLRPWLLLFLLIPIGLLLKKIKTSNKSSWEEVCDKHLLDFLIVNEMGVQKINFKKYIYLGLIFACISAAGPSWKKIDVQTFSIENPSMFVLSLAQDMQLTDVSPSRLDRAKYIISDVAENVSVQGQYGIMVYSDEPYLISPITDDINIIKSLLHQIVPDIAPDNGDRLDRAISFALERFKSAGYSKGNIVLLCSDVGQRFDLAIEKTKEAIALGYSINIVDVSYDGNDKLKLIADTGKGVYLRVFDTSIKPLINKISQTNNSNTQMDKNLRSIYLDFGYYLVFVPLICLLFFFRKGLFVLILCFVSFNAHAGFLLNKNQEGFSLFKKEQYELAKDLFEDTNWQGLSLYMMKNYESAVDKFNKVKSSEGFYNKGVALVKLCKYKDALEAFEESFKLNPKNEDAKYNIDVLNKLFEEAKDNPKLLECKNNQEQDQNDQNKDNQNNNKDKNDNSKNGDDSKDNKDQSEENDKQGENEDQKEQESEGNNKDNTNKENSNQSEKEDNNKQDNEQKNSENSDKLNNQEQNSQQNKDSENSNSNENNSDKQSDEESVSQQNNENKNSQQNKSKNKAQSKQSNQDKQSNQPQNNSEEKDEYQQNIKQIKLQNGNSNEKHDEEDMFLQSMYRKIPEDVGGLLREFIKKEYIKDRYRDESL